MKTKAFLLIVFACVLWGTSGIFVHFLSPVGYSSLNMTGIRAVVAFLCMFGYSLAFKRKSLRIKKSGFLLSVAMGVSFFATAAFYFTSMQLTSVSTAVVLMYTAPIYVTLYSSLFLGEKMTKPKLLAVALVVLGCVMVSGAIGEMSFDPLGVAIGVLSGIAYAAYNVFAKISMRAGNDAGSATLYCFLAATVVAVIVADPIGVVKVTAQNPIAYIPALIALGIVTCVVPYFAYTTAMRTLPAGVVSSLGIIEPMSATLFSVLLFGEELGIVKIIGILIILIAVALLGREKE